MTVSELIKALQGLPQDHEVWTIAGIPILDAVLNHDANGPFVKLIPRKLEDM